MVGDREHYRTKVASALKALNEQAQKVVQACEEEEAALAMDHFLPTMRGVLTTEKAFPGSPGSHKPLPDDSVVRLNVGGCTEFVTTRCTLSCLHKSRLGRIFREGWDKFLPKDGEGHVFLDLDPVQFRALLDWFADVRQLNLEDELPPHPAEFLAPEHQWGFAALCQEMGIPSIGEKSSTGGRKVRELLGIKVEEATTPSSMQCPESRILTEDLVQSLGAFLGSAGEGQSLVLLYRASWDGHTAQAFHQRCDGKGPSVVVARSAGGHIFGGFAPEPWDGSGTHKVTSAEAFLFRLSGPGVSKSKHLCILGQPAMYCHSGSMPTFGLNDLRIHHQNRIFKASFCLGSSYKQQGTNSGSPLSTLAESAEVQLVDWEVFQLVPSTEAQEFSGSGAPLPPCIDSQSSSLLTSIRGWQQSLAERRSSMEHAREQLPEELRFLRHLAGRGSEGHDALEIVHLNVRGVKLATFKATLQQHPNSMLASKFSDRWDLQDSELVEGAVFFDQDPELFSVMLQGLRLRSLGHAESAGRPCVRPSKKGRMARLAEYLNMEEVLHTQTSFDSMCLSPHMEKALLDLTTEVRRKDPELLYRGTRDGFSSQAFHAHCDGKGPSVVLLQSAEGHVFGGFTEASWDSSAGNKTCSQAFLFMLGKGIEADPTIHKMWQSTIDCHRHSGPSFGGSPALIVQLEGSTASVQVQFNCLLATLGRGRCALVGGSYVLVEVEVFSV